MRLHFANKLNPKDYLLHADMFNVNKFPTSANVINIGLGESNLLNIAGGISSQNNTVYIYGVAGFIIHRLEQLKFSCRDFGAVKGKIIILNAGKIGYSKLGSGHSILDDEPIMKMLNIAFYAPLTLEEFDNILNDLEKKENGIYYIQLGKDYER